MSLAEELNISKEEVEATAKRINYMLQLQKQSDQVKSIHLETVLEDWKVLARRMRKGEVLLSKKPINSKNPENLYLFLFRVFEFYNRYFQEMLSQQDFLQVKEVIANILKMEDEG